MNNWKSLYKILQNQISKLKIHNKEVIYMFGYITLALIAYCINQVVLPISIPLAIFCYGYAYTMIKQTEKAFAGIKKQLLN